MPGFTIGTYDYGASNKQNLIVAINAANNTNYTLDEFDFTDPERVTIPNPTYNSKIRLGPKAATGMIGFKVIYYNRIHASDIGPLKITWQNEQFLTELLPRLSEKYGIALTTDDVYEQRIVPPVAPETEVSLTLNFKETSVAYYGGTAIVLGSNDPSLEFETPETLPFKNELVFFVNNFFKTKTGQNYLESSILGIAGDNLRSRTLTITNTDTVAYSNIIKNTYTDEQRSKLEKYLPFVFTWTVGDSKVVRGINIYGDVVEINETSNLVTKLKSIININPLGSGELDVARNKVLVREGTQAKDGSIYFLVGNPETLVVELYKSSDFGEVFTKVTVDTTNRASFNYNNWEDVIIHDLIVVGNKLSILVTNPNTYGVNPTKRSNGPAVEEFNLSTGASDYFPINPEFNTNTGFSFVYNNKTLMRFITVEDEPAILDVVSIPRTSNTLEHVVVRHTRQEGFEFTTEALGSKFLDYDIYGISAFSKPLKKDTTGRFIAIEVLTVTDTSKKDDFFLVETGIRGENTFMGYGLVSFSGIAKADKIGGWSESNLDFEGGSKPTFVTVTEKGCRNHYVFCGNNAIFKTKYTESAPNVFTPSLVKVFNVQGNPGFNLECDIGNGKFVSPELFENVLFAQDYFDFPADESLKPPVNFSFIAKHKVTNKDIWLTSDSEINPLTERTFGREYRALGTTPLAVFSDSKSNLYAFTANQGIFKSADGGNTWADHYSYKNYYENDKYLGSSRIEFLSTDIKRVNCLNGITFIEVNPERTIEVLKLDTLENNFNLHLNDRVIYKFDDTKKSGDVEFNSSYITTSLNNTSDLSPRNTIAWDTDKNNNIRAYGYFTDKGVLTNYDQIDIPEILKQGIFAIYSDVEFLGLKAIVLANNVTDGNNLYLIKPDNSYTTIGLKNSLSPQFTNFVPKGILPLWVGNDDVIGYTPIIIYSDSKDILVLERDGLAGANMTVNIQLLDVPSDNAKPIKWFPMFNSNRADMCVFQEDNAIFKINYTWDAANTVSVVSLIKMFDLATLNLKDVVSGCLFNQPDVEPFGETVIGPWPDYGTVLGNDCQGYNKRNKIADGFGGYFWKVIQTNSEDCGYIEPVPSDTGLGGANINIG